MAATTPIAGTAFIRVDGVQYQLRGSLKVDPATETAEMVAGQDGVHGFRTTPVVPSIEGELSDSGGLSVLQLQNLRGVTVTAELANGKVYVLTGAVFAGRAAIETTDGKIPVKFEGVACREVL